MKRSIGIALLSLGLILGLSACSDDFKDSCGARGGQIMSDSTSVTGVGGNGTVTTSSVRVRLCILNGDVIDMEVS
jgi:hypothetical protein